MAGWLRVEFYAQLPDGLEIRDVDDRRVADELTQVFGFSRVDRVRIEQADDGEIRARRLVDERPRQAFGGPDHPAHPSRESDS